MMINAKRMWSRLEELSHIGEQENGGISRFSFTGEERKAKDLVIAYMEQAGMTVREDAVGNLIGRKEGRRKETPAVLIGSHIDTVPNGGKFDGALGVIAGIEVVQTLTEQKVETDHPIEVIAFTDEEGSRFGFGMIGSRAFAGTLTQDDLRSQDQAGVTIAEAMTANGLCPADLEQAARKPQSVKAYLEMHIEQGKVLESNGLPVGVVTGIAGHLWTKWTLIGEAGHAGATPMSMRKDPLMTAAKVMQVIEAEAKAYQHAVATVGQISVRPGGVNVIPSHVQFTVDLRDSDEEVRNQVEERITNQAKKLCDVQGIALQIDTMQRVAPAPCATSIREAVEVACEKLGIVPFSLPSGAGHDGMQLTGLCPIGMIFVRSKEGISHNPREWSSENDCASGATVLYETVLQLANQQ